MVAPSKYFFYKVGTDKFSCQPFIHNGSCWDSTVFNFTQTISGCAKFVLPIVMLSFLMKIKKLNKQVFVDSAILFRDYFLGAWLMSAFGLSFICLFRRIVGRFNYLTVLPIPGGLGAVICTLVLPLKVVDHYAHGLSSIAAEISLSRGDFYIFKWMKESRGLFTFAFMVVNGLLLHGLRENNDNGFYWLIAPNKRRRDEQDIAEDSPIIECLIPHTKSQPKSCPHANSCDYHIIEGIKSFMKFGIGLEIARNIIYNYKVLLASPFKGLQAMLKQLNWSLVGFLMTYVGIYRTMNCITRRCNRNEDDHQEARQHFLTSVVTGLSFYIHPNISIFAHTFLTTVEVYWRMYKTDIGKILKWLPTKKFSLSRLIYPLVFGYLLHVRAHTPWLAPSLLKKLMSLTTSYKDLVIYTNYHERLFGLKPQFIL